MGECKGNVKSRHLGTEPQKEGSPKWKEVPVLNGRLCQHPQSHHLISSSPHNALKSNLINGVFQIRDQRLREGKWPVQSQSGQVCGVQDQRAGSSLHLRLSPHRTAGIAVFRSWMQAVRLGDGDWETSRCLAGGPLAPLESSVSPAEGAEPLAGV